MKNKTFLNCIFFVLVIFSLSACMKDEFLESMSEVTIEVDNSKLEGEYRLSNVTVQLMEINSQSTTSVTIAEDAEVTSTSLRYGTYTASLEGDITITINGEEKLMKVKAHQANIVVNAETTTVSLEPFLSDPSANFVFKEIFFTGTLTEEGKLYNGDKYFIIHNNSSDTLYADGIFIAQSDFLTTSKMTYSPDVMKEAVSSDQIFRIPGNGTEYPVLPGEDFIIANNAIDHTVGNPKSFDLSNADFEIELIGSINIDNPSVPNTINVSGNLLMHNQGYTAYVMGRFPQGIDDDKFKEENAYTYSYIAANGREMKFDSFKIPNDYIVDAVNLSVKSGFEWLVTAPTLDIGWSYAGLTKKDAERYNKSVIRKQLGVLDNGKPLLQDTNNSTNDFQPAVKASLLN